MKKIAVRFEQVPATDEIEILVRASEKSEEVDTLLRQITGLSSSQLTVKDEAGSLRAIAFSDISLISAKGKQVTVATPEGKFQSGLSLQALEDLLDPQRFLRISRSEIVNLTRVKRYDFSLGGTLRITLADGTKTWASRGCIPQIRQRLTGKKEV